MEKNIGRIWLALLVLALAIVVLSMGDSLKVVEAKEGEAPFLTALTQLGILYVVALFVERSLEVLMKAWRQGGKSRLEEAVRLAEDDAKGEAEKALEEYRAGTQRRALLAGLTLGILVSLSGVRLLAPIFEFGAPEGWSFQQAVFQFTDIIVTAGLIAGGSKSIHELMALIDDFLKASRKTRKGIIKPASIRRAGVDASVRLAAQSSEQVMAAHPTRHHPRDGAKWFGPYKSERGSRRNRRTRARITSTDGGGNRIHWRPDLDACQQAGARAWACPPARARQAPPCGRCAGLRPAIPPRPPARGAECGEFARLDARPDPAAGAGVRQGHGPATAFALQLRQRGILQGLHSPGQLSDLPASAEPPLDRRGGPPDHVVAEAPPGVADPPAPPGFPVVAGMSSISPRSSLMTTSQASRRSGGTSRSATWMAAVSISRSSSLARHSERQANWCGGSG